MSSMPGIRLDLINLYVCGPADCLLAVRADVTSFHNAPRTESMYVRTYTCMSVCVRARTRVYTFTKRAVYINAQAQGSLFSIERISPLYVPAGRPALSLYSLSFYPK
jgi:hypothetical protein